MTIPGALRRLLAWTGLGVAILCASWAVAVAISGGFGANVFGVPISSHDPVRPALLSLILLALAAAGHGATRTWALVAHGAARLDRWWPAALVSIAALAVGLPGDGRPDLGVALVLLTALLGRLSGSMRLGIAGAILVAASPTLRSATGPDLAAAVTWAGACALLLAVPLVPGARFAIAAGVVSALAIVLSPTLALLGGLLTIWLFRANRRAEAAFFVAAALQGAVVAAALNFARHGAALTFDRGPLDQMFSWTGAAVNARAYFEVFRGSHTAVPLAGLIALAAPIARIWPSAPDRRAATMAAAVVLFVVAHGIFSTSTAPPGSDALSVFLPAWPFLMLGASQLAFAVIRSSAPPMKLAVLWIFAAAVVFAGCQGRG